VSTINAEKENKETDLRDFSTPGKKGSKHTSEKLIMMTLTSVP
jgi:hypothetical protein